MIQLDQKFILFVQIFNICYFLTACNMAYLATAQLDYLDHVIHFDGFFFIIPRQSFNWIGFGVDIFGIIYSNNVMLFDAKICLNDILKKFLLEQKISVKYSFNKKYFNNKNIAKLVRERYIKLYRLFSSILIITGLFIFYLIFYYTCKTMFLFQI